MTNPFILRAHLNLRYVGVGAGSVCRRVGIRQSAIFFIRLYFCYFCYRIPLKLPAKERKVFLLRDSYLPLVIHFFWSAFASCLALFQSRFFPLDLNGAKYVCNAGEKSGNAIHNPNF